MTENIIRIKKTLKKHFKTVIDIFLRKKGPDLAEMTSSV